MFERSPKQAIQLARDVLSVVKENKSVVCIWSSFSFLNLELLKLLKFQNWQSSKVIFSYVKEVTFGKYLGVGVGCQGNQLEI